MSIISKVRDEVLRLNQWYIENVDNYNFWEQHIKFVTKNAVMLAERYGADTEIVELGALLHDIALVSNIGTKADHHTNGVVIARSLLTKFGYSCDRLEKVLGCIEHHRSSKYTTNIEELCVADADILAHYDNIPMCFEVAYKFKNMTNATKEEWITYFSKDYNDLSDKTKEVFKDKYLQIIDTLFGSL